LQDESLDRDWEVAELVFHVGQMLHHIRHHLVELLEIVLGARVRQSHHKLIGELIEQSIVVTQEPDEVLILVQGVWQVARNQTQVVVIFDVDRRVERIGHFPLAIGNGFRLARELDVG